MNTTHEPSIDDILKGLEVIYPDVNWENLRVYEKDGKGNRVEITDPIIELEGNLHPQIVEKEDDEPMDEYEDTRDNINESEE